MKPTRVLTSMVSAGSDATTKALDSLASQLGDEKPVMMVAMASPVHPLSEVMAAVTSRFPGLPVLGTATAGEFTQQGDIKGGVALWALCGPFEVRAGFGAGMKSNPEDAVRAAVGGHPEAVEGYPHRTAIMLLDPLSGVGEEATLLAASMLGPDVPLAGGAAGDDLAMKHTPVALGTQVSEDAVAGVVIYSKQPLGLGVSHGHRALSSPLKVTRAEGATVMEIDGRPAWDVWKDKTRAAARTRGVDVDTLAADKEGGFLLTFEAGLETGSALKIRAPLSRTESGGLNFACGIPQGAELRITESEPAAQVASALDAARKARLALGGQKIAGALVFDCICRYLILGPQFKDAVMGMAQELGGVPLAGFETYGEIALAAGDFSGFHNTTTVVLAFPQ